MAGSHSCYNALPDRRYWRPTPGCLPLGSRSREPAATPLLAAGSFRLRCGHLIPHSARKALWPGSAGIARDTM